MAEYTIKDIARMVGVSTGTVSRVLNKADNIDPELYRRTMEVLRTTNYKPGSRGRRPGQRRRSCDDLAVANTIAVVSPEMSPSWKNNELWTSYLSGLERACRERGYHLSVYMGNPDVATTGSDIPQRAGGVLLKMGAVTPDYIKDLVKRLPVVGFGGYNPLLPFPQIALDNHAAGMIVAERLLQLGHRRVAFVNMDCRHHMFISRSNGYVEAMKRAGKYDPVLLVEFCEKDKAIVNEPSATPPDMTAVLDYLLGMAERPTAVVFANDWMAFGFYKACAARGMRVPEDISVAGVDDVGTLCEVLTPALASVAMPFDRVAYFAACSLFDLMEGVGQHRQNIASVQYLPGVLHERASIRALK